jgi:hypothetical protein
MYCQARKSPSGGVELSLLEPLQRFLLLVTLLLSFFSLSFLFLKPHSSSSDQTQIHNFHAYRALSPLLLASPSVPSNHHPSVSTCLLPSILNSSLLYPFSLGSKASLPLDRNSGSSTRSPSTTQPHEVFAASLDPPLSRSSLPLHLPDIRSHLGLKLPGLRRSTRPLRGRSITTRCPMNCDHG